MRSALTRSIVLVLLLVACRWRGGNELALGEIAARTGDRALWGEDLHRGIELGVELQNAHGGLNGRRLRLVVADDESHEERAGTLTARMVEHDSPLVVFGELSSAACERAAQAAGRRGVPFVAPASAAHDISLVGDFAFRTGPTDAEHAQAMARHARQNLQRRRAAIVYRRSSMLALASADAFAHAFRSQGGDVVLRDSFADDTELVHLVARVRTSTVDVVYAPAGTTDAGHIAVAVRQGRVTAQLLGSDGWSSADVRRFAQDAVVGVLFTDAFSPNVPRPEVDAFVNAFRERYHALPGTFAALGRDAVRWVLLVASRMPLVEPRALRDLLPGSRLDDSVAPPFSVDPRRSLLRPVYILRYERDGVGVVTTMSP